MTPPEWAKILERAINLPPRVAVLILAVLIGLFAWHTDSRLAGQAARIVPIERAVSEQTQMMRYLVCVDRRGGPTPLTRENCAADHLSSELRGILGGDQ